MSGFDLLGSSGLLGFDARVSLVVDSKTRASDASGEGVYLLHAAGDASHFGPGSALLTPDGIVWDVVSVDADRRGLTVSKRRADVSLVAWLLGDWSSLSGAASSPDARDAGRREVATTREAAPRAPAHPGTASEDASWPTRHWKAALAVGAVVGAGVVAAPVVGSLLAARAAKS